MDQRQRASLISMIADRFNVPVSAVTGKTNFAQDLNLDSIDSLELIMALEDTYDISVSDADASKLQTVGDVIKLIDKKLSVIYKQFIHITYNHKNSSIKQE